MRSEIIQLLNEMPPISLEEMDAVRLMNRIDTKFIIPTERFEPFLKKIKDEYFVQDINGKRVNNYHTTYLDTPADDMFIAHQNGKTDREKIRIREYVDSDLTFLEVKHKNNKGQTRKVRTGIKNKDHFRVEKNAEFLHSHSRYELDNLFPVLENNFYRITLVNRSKTERLTLDCDINFLNLETLKKEIISDFVIIEVKQEGESYSPVRDIMNRDRIRQVSVSKYCLGAVLTNPSLKYNRFKSKLIQINKLTNKSYGYTF